MEHAFSSYVYNRSLLIIFTQGKTRYVHARRVNSATIRVVFLLLVVVKYLGCSCNDSCSCCHSESCGRRSIVKAVVVTVIIVMVNVLSSSLIMVIIHVKVISRCRLHGP